MSSKTSNRTSGSKTRWRTLVSLFAPVVLMAFFGAYVGLTAPQETKAAYVRTLMDGLLFAVAPIGAAVVLFALYRLVTWPFRS